MITFRPEGPHDASPIHELIQDSFGRETEARLVERLCTTGQALISHIAEDDESIVGHVLFSDTPITIGDKLLRGSMLAPLSVSTRYQGQGIGGALIMYGLRECKARGDQVVLAVGGAAYYARFGFSPAAAAGLTPRWDNISLPLQALELEPGIIDGAPGSILYPDAFNIS